jgi:type IV pilus assembly protein PilV
MKLRHTTSGSGGFSLVEVMVAVLVISIGLLGIAKMQALALSSTGNARLRALASLEAASLASAIRADRTYWAASAIVGNDLKVTIAGTAITPSDPQLSSTVGCDVSKPGYGGGPCTASEMAAYDLQTWANALNALIPSDSGFIDCTQPVAASPVTCTVQLNWTENEVAANAAAAAGPAMSMPQYTLYVEP